MIDNEGQRILSDIVTFNKYARYRKDLKRRETWEEIIDRYVAMMLKKYCGKEVAEQFRNKKVTVEKGSLAAQIIENAKYLYRKDTLPSMRAAQFGGPAMEKNHARGYNCSFLPVDHYKAFSETMFLLLTGCGVGYSVQQRHISKLPEIKKPTLSKKFLIADNIEGWADAIKQLMKSYFGVVKYKPRFDFSDIREKGEPLITSGGKAPGPEPLKICLAKIEMILKNKEDGSQLTDVECHDIQCHIADSVLAGGIRRAAMISLFSFDSKAMATCKHGAWWENNPQRGRANNSAVLPRSKVTEDQFKTFFSVIKDSGSGEPGVSWTNDPDMGFNPCHEISLLPFQFCNLVEINAGNIIDQEDFNNRARVAAFFSTLQAGFTDFHYLRNIWRTTTEKEALAGVGITGICNGNILTLDLVEASNIVMDENEKVAEIIGINKAARTTTIKPSGTTSTVLGTSSGIHAWHSMHYIRNMQCKVGDDLFTYFSNNHPELIKVMAYDPASAVIGIPQRAPTGAILRDDESAVTFLDRVKRFNVEWVHNGHRSGDNKNNVSATCNIRENEWDEVGDWMWVNRDSYSGISVLPYDNGTYKDAPFEVCDKETYERKMEYLRNNPIDLTKIVEEADNTDLQGELACTGGACELVY